MTLDIVIPMAGRGSRFADAGYDLPKPLIDVNGRPMIEVVVENLRPSRQHRFIFLVLEEHLQRYTVAPLLERLAPGCGIVPVRGVTEGAACTVLLAKAHISASRPLMIANSDQWVSVDINAYLAASDGLPGMIMTMTASDPKWSYVKLDDSGRVSEVVEKQVVSDEATVGIYNYVSGTSFVEAADSMIRAGERVNGEFYVAPTYNTLIARGEKVSFYNIGSVAEGMYGLGTPDDLAEFLRSPHSK